MDSGIGFCSHALDYQRIWDSQSFFDELTDERAMNVRASFHVICIDDNLLALMAIEEQVRRFPTQARKKICMQMNFFLSQNAA